MSKGLLFDSTQCVGCKQCEESCARRWGLPYDGKVAAEPRISAHKLTAVETHGERFSRKLCMHCADPTCVSVCPVGAFQKTAAGPVVYEEARCIGCRYCMLACPFQVPAYTWESRLPEVRKCTMCADRPLNKPTACSEGCPAGATITGDRDRLIMEAQRRIREKPGEYYPRIFGLREVGGTSILILAGVPFDKIGLKTGLPQEPLPALTWRALSHVPDVAMMGSVLMGGVYWITHRRREVAAAEGGSARKGDRQ